MARITLNPTSKGQNSRVFSVDDYGAPANGTDDDTPAFNAAIAAANTYIAGIGSSSGAIITGSNKKYRLNSATTPITNNAVYWEFSGRYPTFIDYRAATGNAFSWDGSGTEIFEGGMKNVAIRANDTSSTKKAIYAVDTSKFCFENILISNWYGGDSIGLHTAGREMLTCSKLAISATVPIRLSANPQGASALYLSADAFHFSDLFLNPGSSAPSTLTRACFLIDSDVMVTNLTLDGYQAWIQYLHGLYYDRTDTTAGVSSCIFIKGVRTEQASVAGGHTFHIVAPSASRTLDVHFDDCRASVSSQVPIGFYLRNINRVLLANCFRTADNTTAAIDVDGLNGLTLLNSELLSTANSFANMRLTSAVRSGSSDVRLRTTPDMIGTWSKDDGTTSTLKPNMEQDGLEKITLCNKTFALADNTAFVLPVSSNGIPLFDFGTIKIRAKDSARAGVCNSYAEFTLSADTSDAYNGLKPIGDLDSEWCLSRYTTQTPGKIGIRIVNGVGLTANVELRHRLGVNVDFQVIIEGSRTSSGT